MGKKENLRLVPIVRKQPDLRKLARALLVLVGELPSSDVTPLPKAGDAEAES